MTRKDDQSGRPEACQCEVCGQIYLWYPDDEEDPECPNCGESGAEEDQNEDQSSPLW